MVTGWPLICCLPRIPLCIGPRGYVGGVYPGRTLCRQRHHQTGRMHLPREARLSLMHPRTANLSFSTRYLYMYASGFYVHFFFLPFFTVKNYSTGLSTAAWIFYQASINNSDVSIQFKPCTSIKYRKDMVMFKGALYWKACLFEYQKLKSCRPEKWETSPPLIHIFCMFQILRVSTTELNSSSVSQYRLLIAMKLWWK